MVYIFALVEYNSWGKQLNGNIVVSSKPHYLIGVYKVINSWEYDNIPFR